MEDFTNNNNMDNDINNVNGDINTNSGENADSNINTNSDSTAYVNEAPSAKAPAAEASVQEAPAHGEPLDARYAGYIDNNVTWNGSSYSGRPQQGNTCYTSGQPYNYGQATYQQGGATGYSNSYCSPCSGATYTQDATGAYTANDSVSRNYRFVSEPVMKPTPAKNKKVMPKAVAVILLALLFGVVASGAFIGTNAIYNALNPDGAVSSAIDFGSINPNPSFPKPDSRTDNSNNVTGKPGLISSTDIITDVNASATDVSSVVDLAMPSIVSIDCTFNTQSFFGTYETAGAGSGIILKKTESELLVATNNHVVANAITINVTFDDGTTAPATTKGTDAVADLAVVSVNIEDLSKDTLAAIRVATLGDSDSVKVGQMVVAIGNAMGYGQSTTVGYVSAKDREVTVEGNTMTLLQTDAAINPGNSGGALLNLTGEVIGINSVKYADSDVEGMGFAIPISRATNILDELANREILKDEEKGYLGIYLQDVTSSVAEYYNMPIGVYVYEIMDDSAAGKAGIEVGDIITAVNGRKVATSTDLKNEVTSHRAGTTISITFMRLKRGAYQEMTLDVTLGVNPENTAKMN